MRATALVAGTLLLAACTGGTTPQEPSPSSAPEPSESAPSEPAATTTPAEDQPFDCDAVATAQADLGAEATAQLERLGIDRTAPEAFTVVLVATSQGAAEYWASILEATQPAAGADLREQVAGVADYWAGLDEQLDAITIEDASPQSVQAAADELSAVSGSAEDTELGPAQQAVQDALSAACGNEPPAAPTSSSPTT